jgi:integrase/recombinase XerD
MLTLYRRHRSPCKHRSRRYKSCSCPIWVQGVLHGIRVRRSLDLTNWEAASRKINELEIYGQGASATIAEACEKFIADAEARMLKEQSIKKYRHLMAELKKKWGARSMRSITVDDIRELRNSWKLSGATARKRLELLRGFFNFGVTSGWLGLNSARMVKSPKTKHAQTMPYSEYEWQKITEALDIYKKVHVQSPVKIHQKLRALFYLLRYSGLRISDAVVLTPDRIDGQGRLFLYQAKSDKPVMIPLPKVALDLLTICEDENEYYFWSGVGKVKTAITEWQERLKKVVEIAGVVNGRGVAHKLRDTFSVSLLEKSVPIETVAMLLGNSVKVCERHYAPWVKSRQDAVEQSVRLAWS